MKILRRTLETICTLAVMNIFLLNHLFNQFFPDWGSRLFVKPALLGTLLFIYIILEIIPCYEKGLKFRLQVLKGGYELVVTSFYSLMLELIVYGIFLFLGSHPGSTLFEETGLAVTNALVAYLVLLLHYQNGFWQTAICSAQLGIKLRVLMLIFWWVPIANIILFYNWCATVRRELIYESNQYRLNQARIENEICRTRYPVVMVHGVFFRDWQYRNYWGRIPQALKKNGATVYYGKQQSALAIEDSGAELKTEILRVLEETGAEKVNIVAHSKGGLDARYAIVHLGLENQVASLTTINTPHRGCHYADVLLQKSPKWLIHFVATRYNKLFQRLGDEAPDFLGGVKGLTASACAAFNECTPDSPKVYYQSVMSKMNSHRSTFFLLSISYLFIKLFDGENDGLVSITSAPWGNYLGLLTAPKKGISHGDIIDLTHTNVRGFDVCEFYVKLFEGLKKRGL